MSYNVNHKHQDMIPEGHKCSRCKLGKDKVTFNVSDMYTRKMCNSCRHVQYVGIKEPKLRKVVRELTRLERIKNISNDIREYFYG